MNHLNHLGKAMLGGRSLESGAASTLSPDLPRSSFRLPSQHPAGLQPAAGDLVLDEDTGSLPSVKPSTALLPLRIPPPRHLWTSGPPHHRLHCLTSPASIRGLRFKTPAVVNILISLFAVSRISDLVAGQSRRACRLDEVAISRNCSPPLEAAPIASQYSASSRLQPASLPLMKPSCGGAHLSDLAEKAQNGAPFRHFIDAAILKFFLFRCLK